LKHDWRDCAPVATLWTQGCVVSQRNSPLLFALGLLLAWPILGQGSARAANVTLTAFSTIPLTSHVYAVDPEIAVWSDAGPGYELVAELPLSSLPLSSEPLDANAKGSNSQGAGGTTGGSGASGARQAGALIYFAPVLDLSTACFAPAEGRCDLSSSPRGLFRPPRAAAL
jgi:hypothetical protein